MIYNTVTASAMKAKVSVFQNRYGAHMRNMKNENAREHNYHLYRSMRKHGIENFRFYFRRTFKFEGREKLSDTERKAFNKKFKDAVSLPVRNVLDSASLLDPNKGYNRKESGEGGAGHVWTDETEGENERGTMGKRANQTVTRCEILEDGETHSESPSDTLRVCSAAERANPGASHETSPTAV